MKIMAPWNKIQIRSLNEFQDSGLMHPFTCAKCGSQLVAQSDGWVCSSENFPEGNCNYTQNWAHDFMADWSWKKLNTEASITQPKPEYRD